jgi:hypothetical protein
MRQKAWKRSVGVAAVIAATGLTAGDAAIGGGPAMVIMAQGRGGATDMDIVPGGPVLAGPGGPMPAFGPIAMATIGKTQRDKLAQALESIVPAPG